MPATPPASDSVRHFPWLACLLEKCWSPPLPPAAAPDSSTPEPHLPARSDLRPLSTLLAPVDPPATVTRHPPPA